MREKIRACSWAVVAILGSVTIAGAMPPPVDDPPEDPVPTPPRPPVLLAMLATDASGYDAGSVQIGGSAQATVIVSEVGGERNAGGVTYAVTAPFAITSTTCGAIIPPDSSCSLTIGFSPTTPGVQTGALTIQYFRRGTAVAATVTATLVGTGVSPPPPPPLAIHGSWLSYHTNQYEEDVGQGALYQYFIDSGFTGVPAVVYSPTGQLPYTPHDPIYGGDYHGTSHIAAKLPDYILTYGPVGSPDYNAVAQASQRLALGSFLHLFSTGGTDPRLSDPACDLVVSDAANPVDFAAGRGAYNAQLVAVYPFASCTNLSQQGGSATVMNMTDLFRTTPDGRSPFLDALCAGRVGTFTTTVNLTASVADYARGSYLFQYAPPPARAWGYNGQINVVANCVP